MPEIAGKRAPQRARRAVARLAALPPITEGAVSLTPDWLERSAHAIRRLARVHPDDAALLAPALKLIEQHLSLRGE